MEVGGVGSYGNCGSRVGFLTLLPAASIEFFCAFSLILPGNSNKKLAIISITNFWYLYKVI